MEGAPVEFCTLGMFIIDEIHFPPPKPSVFNIMGGAGLYSALGARIFSAPPHSKSVGWIVDAGSDFPEVLRVKIKDWQTNCLIRETPERLTTRGWNEYGKGEQRAFRYLTPKMRLDETSLNPQLLMAESFHLICSPERCIKLVEGILQARKVQTQNTERPVFIWEPVPNMCTPEELPRCFEALKHVDVMSPNHDELGAFLSLSMTDKIGRPDEVAIEEASAQFSDVSIVVRAGKRGSYVQHKGQARWLPAYHTDSRLVVDPTGGGNAFLGGLAVGFLRSAGRSHFEALVEGAIFGSVAASFAIEQLGPPELDENSSGETWNGVSVQNRIGLFKGRLKDHKELADG